MDLSTLLAISGPELVLIIAVPIAVILILAVLLRVLVYRGPRTPTRFPTAPGQPTTDSPTTSPTDEET